MTTSREERRAPERGDESPGSSLVRIAGKV
jgi:hypothetical protein